MNASHHAPADELITQRWYPIYLSARLKDKPVSLERLNQRIVLWRDGSAVAHANPASCPHRGANLGLGKVVDGCLECPYHGFRFSASGACVLTPCDGPQARIRSDLHLEALPLQEAHGLLWLWYGDGQPDEHVPMFEGYDTAYPQGVWAELCWDVSLSRVVEGMLDMHHVPFAHAGVVRSKATMLDPYTVEQDGDLIITKGTMRSPEGGRGYDLELHALFPALVRVMLPPKVDVLVALCPLDDKRTWIGMRYQQHLINLPLLGSLWTRFLAWTELRFVQPDDELMLLESWPEHGDSRVNHLVRADAGIATWHKLKRASSPPALKASR